MRAPGIVVAIIVIFCGAPSMAADGIEQGHAIVVANCAGCHATRVESTIAPEWVTIAAAAPRISPETPDEISDRIPFKVGHGHRPLLSSQANRTP